MGVCIQYRCKWPRHVNKKFIMPKVFSCQNNLDTECDTKLKGSVCRTLYDTSAQYVCVCREGYKELYGRCVPIRKSKYLLKLT